MARSFEEFQKRIKDPDSAEHADLLKHVRSRITTSRTKMSKHYAQWDSLDAVFRSRKPLDREDRNAIDKGQPAKMVVPTVFSQVMTFVSFNIAMLSQNDRFFTFSPTGSEDNPLLEPMEQIIDRDLRRNKWTTFLIQFFLDIGRFGLAAGEVCYLEQYRQIRVAKEETIAGVFGSTETKKTFGYEQVPTFIGNRVYPLSPYRIFPDVSLPLSRYQEGEYFGSEDMFTIASLRDQNTFSLDKIPKMIKEDFEKRREMSRIDMMDTRSKGTGGDGARPTDDAYVKSGSVVVTKIVIDIVPKDVKFNDEPLGDEDFPVRYIVWYSNDATIIRFEEAYYLHGQFPYMLAQFLPDQHQLVNESLADLCEQTSSLITWLVNAHVTSIRSSIESKYIVDPAGIDIRSLQSRSPYIFLRKNASQTGVDRYIKQFQTQDNTQNFMQDVSNLKELMENASGFSAAMQGQYSSGRRSATQDRVVSQAGSARGKTTLASIWEEAFAPLGRQLISNNRQEMDMETFARILGNIENIELLFEGFKSTPLDIAAAEDFFVFDSTIPSEKAYLAQSMQEILMTMMQNPEVAGILGYGPEQIRVLFNEIYTLRGVSANRLPTPMPPQQVAPPVVPPQAAGVVQPSLPNG